MPELTRYLGQQQPNSLTFDINGVDIGSGTQTITGIETLTIATSGTAVLDGALTMTATAATETLNVTGTAGTLTLGNITADKIDTSGFTGTSVTMGTAQQLVNIVGGSSAETITGSTSADLFSMGGGADSIQNTASGANVTANDIMTGGAGFDTFTLIGSANSGTNYLSVPNITDFTVGTTTTNTDQLRFNAANTDYEDDNGSAAGLAETSGTNSLVASDAVVMQTIALNAAAAAEASTTVNVFKLTTSTAFTTNHQATFNAAIGTATITGIGAEVQILTLMHDSTNSKMVVMSVDCNGGTATIIETGDSVDVIATVDMTAADYAIFDADNIAAFV